MIIDRVTMTGPDDSISANDLTFLSKKYPFVEWGILLSRSSKGSIRFPSFGWMNELRAINEGAKMVLSGHICGSWTRELLMGSDAVFNELGMIASMFERFQINTHAIPHEKNLAGFTEILKKRDAEFIIQWDETNGEELHRAAFIEGVYPSILFDMSHGAGLVPNKWPARIRCSYPEQPFYCGYAGGLGPDNIESELHRISKAVDSDGFSDVPVWIDMETKIRSANGTTFDLQKVEQMLKVCEPYVKRETI